MLVQCQLRPREIALLHVILAVGREQPPVVYGRGRRTVAVVTAVATVALAVPDTEYEPAP